MTAILMQSLGISVDHVQKSHQFGAQLHLGVESALQQLRQAGRRYGFELAVVSGFRSAERQLTIWNAKASGQRVLLNTEERPVNYADLDEVSLMHTILRWSALPGASRHHWGCDMDVIDAAAVASLSDVQLTQAECGENGPFSAFHQWLTEQLSSESFGFYRPYDIDRGGVAPEPWHLSYRPLAEIFENVHSLQGLHDYIAQSDIVLKDCVLAHLPDIYQRYVSVPSE